MQKSQEYVLEKLDEWYSERFRRHYTEELAKEITSKVAKVISEKGEGQLERLLDIVFDKLSREGQIKEAQNYFTQAYATLEAFIEGFEVDGHTIDEMPKDIKDSYRVNTVKQFQKIKRFVDTIRKVATEDVQQELTKSDIEKAFLETFKDYRGFAEFGIGCLDAAINFVNSIGAPKAVPNDYNNLLVVYDLARDIVPYISEQVLGDLRKA